MKRFLPLCLAAMMLCLGACHHETPVPAPPAPVEESPLERVVIVYMMADNNLDPFSTDDMRELEAAKGMIPQGHKVIIYHDGRYATPVIYQLSARDGLTVWKKKEQEENSTDMEVMHATLADIMEHFPAPHYGLVLWSHGSGWVPRKTIGKDENRPSGHGEMNITELAEALSGLPFPKQETDEPSPDTAEDDDGATEEETTDEEEEATGEEDGRFDYIFFDACFMQGIEVAYELKDHAEWIVGSPAEIPGPGAPYDVVMYALCTADIRALVDGYNDAYPCTVRGQHYPGAVLSAVQTSELEALAEVTRPLIPQIFGKDEGMRHEKIQFYCSVPNSYTDCYDMCSAMAFLLPTEQYEEWLPYFHRAVPIRRYAESTATWTANYCYPARITDTEHYGGISMFLPGERYLYMRWNELFRQTRWYEAAGWAQSGW